ADLHGANRANPGANIDHVNSTDRAIRNKTPAQMAAALRDLQNPDATDPAKVNHLKAIGFGDAEVRGAVAHVGNEINAGLNISIVNLLKRFLLSANVGLTPAQKDRANRKLAA